MLTNWSWVSVEMEEGMVPTRELAERSRTVRELRPPRPEGMVPLIPVLATKMVWREGDAVLRLLGRTG